MRSLLPFVVSVLTALVCASGHAGAADAWHATQVAGEVRVEIGNGPAVPLTVAMAIEHDALIETAASGSATLVRGEEHVTVAPNSRLRLPADDGSGFTRIIEEFGQLFFQVGKKTMPHFRVETPMLAATVKGTSFTVTVDDKGANVEVKEGLVLVQNNASQDQTYVPAGRVASVAVAEPMTLYLDHSVVPPSALRLGDGTKRNGFMLSDGSSTVPALPRVPGSNEPEAAAPTAVPQFALTDSAREVNRKHSGGVLDSTLSGIGVGILAAALAIIFIGGSRRAPGMVSANAKRASKDEPAQGA